MAIAPEESAYWIAVGYGLDLAGDAPGALEAMQRAAQLDPSNRTVEVFVLTLLAESGAEAKGTFPAFDVVRSPPRSIRPTDSISAVPNRCLLTT